MPLVTYRGESDAVRLARRCWLVGLLALRAPSLAMQLRALNAMQRVKANPVIGLRIILARHEFHRAARGTLGRHWVAPALQENSRF